MAIYVNVDDDPEKRKEMLALSGGRQQVPVIVDGDKVMVGFVGDVSLRGGIPIFGGT
jgi:glutaredoxin